MPESKITLKVNQIDIPLDRFVSIFIDNVVSGMVVILANGGEIEKINLGIITDDVSIKLNDDLIQLNRFVNMIIGNTVKGMVCSLRGVDQINSLNIEIIK